jgi:uncharacterized phage-associated protein
MINSETYKYTSTEVAKYIVARAVEARITMNMTKLQKLLYVAYGIYLFVKKERLTDEHPKAWPYGPVFPTTRNQLLKNNFSKSPEKLGKITDDKEVETLITLVFNIFGSWTAGQLSEWSHADESPWERTKQGQMIPDEYIEAYFSKIVQIKDGESAGN